jgi:hypothetical protein
VNYLTLCQETIGDTGIAGGDPLAIDTVVGQTGRLGDVVRYVRNACVEIDNLWKDWKYLWFEHTSGVLATSSNAPPGPAFSVQQWDRSTFWLDKFTGSPKQLKYEEWTTFRNRGSTLQTARPTIISVRPDNTLRVNSNCDQDRPFAAEGWRQPVLLAADADVPLMPENFHRIIVARAQIFYANRHDAPEVLEGAEAEYMDMLDKLQSAQCPSFEFERMSQQDIDLAAEVPGYELGASYPRR